MKPVVAALRRPALSALLGGVAALAGGWLGRQAEGPVAAWCTTPRPAQAVRLEPLAVAFVVEATPDAAAEIRGLAAGIAGFREELARAGGDARLGLVVAAGDAAPRAASFEGDPFTADVAAFRTQLEEIATVGTGRPRIAAAIGSATALLGGAEGRRCLVVVSRNASADECSAAVTPLRSAGVAGVSLAVSKEAAGGIEPLRKAVPGAFVALGGRESARDNFELAVPALATGLLKTRSPGPPIRAALLAAAPAAASRACLAGLTTLGLLAALRLLAGRRVGWSLWTGAPVTAAVVGAGLAAAVAASRPILPYADGITAAILGGGIAWLLSSGQPWRQVGVATALAALSTAAATAAVAWLMPAPSWPAAALALGAPLGVILGATGARSTLRARLPGGRVVEVHVGLALTATDVPGLSPATGRGPVAEVVANPKRPGAIGLKNLSRQTWTLVTPDGRTAAVATGRSAELHPGTRIDFGRARAEFV